MHLDIMGEAITAVHPNPNGVRAGMRDDNIDFCLVEGFGSTIRLAVGQPIGRPLIDASVLAAIRMERTPAKADQRTSERCDTAPVMDNDILIGEPMLACLGFLLHLKPCMVFVVSIDDMKGDWESARPPRYEHEHLVGKEPEVANLNSGFYSIVRYALVDAIN